MDQHKACFSLTSTETATADYEHFHILKTSQISWTNILVGWNILNIELYNLNSIWVLDGYCWLIFQFWTM